MKIMKTIIATLALLVQHPLFCQDLQFTQFFQLPTIVNPAYVSVPSGAQVSLGYRRQWGQLQSGFDGLAADATIRIARLGKRLPNNDAQTGLGMGVQVQQSKEPFFGYKEQEATAQIGVFVGNAKKITLHLGLCSTFGRRSVDFDRLVFSGQLDPVFGINNPSTFVPSNTDRVETFTMGGGLAVRGQFSSGNLDFPFSLGGAVRQLAGSREVSFLGAREALLSRIVTIHGSVSWPLSEGFRNVAAWYLTPLFRYDVGGYDNGKKPLQKGVGGLMAQHDFIMFGGMVAFNRLPESGQNTSALIGMLGGTVPLGNNNMVITYNYEVPMKGLGLGASGGAHEITLVFDFPGSALFGAKNRPKQTDCYHFIGKGFRGLMN